ncbi:helix-turn-helix domain-containing protein [Nocardioides convexus]|uniref:TetR/AcrR family transcriptional regulator n=1 Tax=Nocardioides convexus TaxID=2712224 RepID=UPI0024186E56|nr:helix-turn-helix domain-containing protein [Nocardioides convexus]
MKWVDSTVRRRSANEALESDARRAQVVQAAIDAIEEGGASVGMAQIAERAGIPRPHVYRHFASKEQARRRGRPLRRDRVCCGGCVPTCPGPVRRPRSSVA